MVIFQMFIAWAFYCWLNYLTVYLPFYQVSKQIYWSEVHLNLKCSLLQLSAEFTVFNGHISPFNIPSNCDVFPLFRFWYRNLCSCGIAVQAQLQTVDQKQVSHLASITTMSLQPTASKFSHSVVCCPTECHPV